MHVYIYIHTYINILSAYAFIYMGLMSQDMLSSKSFYSDTGYPTRTAGKFNIQMAKHIWGVRRTIATIFMNMTPTVEPDVDAHLVRY